MFHPNIYADGSICLDILQNQWSPIYDVAAILTSIQSLLCDPNPNSPANSEAARMYSESKLYADGRVCLDILQNQWTPVYNVVAILISIQSLLCDPNTNSYANSEAALMYSENKREYNRRVRDVVEQSWN
ncbi:hypothetical protein F2Q70_00040081 [Brassica cretica]|uniref:UBC core domain-containing protein n=1 Tax=Brassica cretica TaxID=69181 RepID=A0A8S9JZ92_BRACR|nr:hypothetical protein F2Q70_00040081 [Brassica cretica]